MNIQYLSSYLLVYFYSTPPVYFYSAFDTTVGAGSKVDQARRLKALEQENAKLLGY